MKCLGIPGQGFEVPGIDRTDRTLGCEVFRYCRTGPGIDRTGIDRTDRTLGCDVLRYSRTGP